MFKHNVFLEMTNKLQRTIISNSLLEINFHLIDKAFHQIYDPQRHKKLRKMHYHDKLKLNKTTYNWELWGVRHVYQNWSHMCPSKLCWPWWFLQKSLRWTSMRLHPLLLSCLLCSQQPLFYWSFVKNFDLSNKHPQKSFHIRPQNNSVTKATWANFNTY